jgi:predicted  nucleic acid-binding Zn-ribbon protein
MAGREHEAQEVVADVVVDRGLEVRLGELLLDLELASTAAELEEHRQALANLATQLTRESEAARANAERLEMRIRQLEAERDGLNELVAGERERFEQTLDALGGGIGRHGNELAELERELEALIAG